MDVSPNAPEIWDDALPSPITHPKIFLNTAVLLYTFIKNTHWPIIVVDGNDC